MDKTHLMGEGHDAQAADQKQAIGDVGLDRGSHASVDEGKTAREPAEAEDTGEQGQQGRTLERGLSQHQCGQHQRGKPDADQPGHLKAGGPCIIGAGDDVAGERHGDQRRVQAHAKRHQHHDKREEAEFARRQAAQEDERGQKMRARHSNRARSRGAIAQGGAQQTAGHAPSPRLGQRPGARDVRDRHGRKVLLTNWNLCASKVKISPAGWSRHSARTAVSAPGSGGKAIPGQRLASRPARGRRRR